MVIGTFSIIPLVYLLMELKDKECLHRRLGHKKLFRM